MYLRVVGQKERIVTLFINISVGNFLGNLVVLLLVHSHPRVHGAALWAVYLSVFGCVC